MGRPSYAQFRTSNPIRGCSVLTGLSLGLQTPGIEGKNGSDQLWPETRILPDRHSGKPLLKHDHPLPLLVATFALYSKEFSTCSRDHMAAYMVQLKIV